MANATIEVRGTTCPLLNIARAYVVDYTAVLQYADSLLHGRHPRDENAVHDMLQTCSVSIVGEIMGVVEFMQDGHRQAEQLERSGMLYFNKESGKWTVSDAQ